MTYKRNVMIEVLTTSFHGQCERLFPMLKHPKTLKTFHESCLEALRWNKIESETEEEKITKAHL